MAESSKRQTILIVDDVPANIKMIGEALKKEHKIRLATDGPKAIQIASSENPPDLILLDIIMPEMDGYEVCRLLKSARRTENIPIIFITAMDQEEDETKGLELGAVDYITKPFSLPIVKARVKTHLELKRHRDILENLSNLDGLTGIPNRRRFDEYLESEWRRSIREENDISLIMIDIDHFKSYNDNYGHDRGDDCLKQVAHTIEATLSRPADFVGRYGGEEFVCVLPKTDMVGAQFIAQKIMQAVAEEHIPHAHSPVAELITVSIGIASVAPAAEMMLHMLIKSADDCLYAAKRGGRNRIESRQVDIPASMVK